MITVSWTDAIEFLIFLVIMGITGTLFFLSMRALWRDSDD